MCIKTKRNRHVYLSMCPCCNIVSKYSTVVNNHINREHSQVGVKYSDKKAIPVRIGSKNVRRIGRSLDQKLLVDIRSQNQQTDKLPKHSVTAVSRHGLTGALAYEENIECKSIFCALCKRKSEGLISYFNHLSAKKHIHCKVSLRCTECNAQFKSVNELMTHNNTHKGLIKLCSDNLECLNEAQINSLQCPYCVTLFQNIEHIYMHIGNKHINRLEVVSIMVEADQNMKTDAENVLLSYKCKYCSELYPDLNNLLQHVIETHPDHSLQPARLQRKRTLPKWLQDTSFEETGIKRKNVRTAKYTGDKHIERKQKKTRTRNAEKCTDENTSIKLQAHMLSSTVVLNKISAHTVIPHGDRVVDLHEQSEIAKKESNDTSKWNEEKSKLVHDQGPLDHDSNCITDESTSNTKVVKPDFKDFTEEVKNSTQFNNETETFPEKTTDTFLMECVDADVEGDSDDDYIPGQDSDENEQNSEDTSDNLSFICKYCDSAEYKHEKSLTRHIRDKHAGLSLPAKIKFRSFNHKKCTDVTKNNSSFTCHVCENAGYSHLKSLKRHVKIKHPHLYTAYFEKEDHVETAGKTDKDNGTERNNRSNKSSQCEYCSHGEFPSVRSLHEHIKSMHPEVGSPAKIRATTDSYDDNVADKDTDENQLENTTSVMKYKCPFCAFYLYHREYIYSHIQNIHPEVVQFTVADIIKYDFGRTQSELSREYFQCPKCDMSSTSINAVLQHFKCQHPSEAPLHSLPCMLPTIFLENDTVKFTCPSCKAVFDGKETFEAHVSEHFDGKPCSFRYQSSLPKTEVMKKPCKKLVSFVCPCCDLVFTRKDTLKGHMKVHVDEVEAHKKQVIKCIMIVPNSQVTEDKLKSSDGNCVIENESIQIDHDEKETVNIRIEVPISHTKLRNGVYICPLCDNFRSLSKDEAVKHMEVKHTNKLIETEMLYVFEAYLDNKERETDKEFSVRCFCCEYSSDNLTDTLRHTWTYHADISRFTYNGSTEFERSDTTTFLENEKSKPLFQIVSLPSTDNELSEEIYKCWLCDPVYIFKTRKGGRKHMLKFHTDQVTSEVTDVLNQMIDVLDAKSWKGYMCTQCNKQKEEENDLIDHFKNTHPDKIEVLEHQIGLFKDQNCNSTMTDCEICHMRCHSRFGLRKHLLLHKNKHKLRCSTCGISFENNDEMVSHCSRAHSESSKMCTVCGKMFLKKEFLRHMKDHEAGNDQRVGKQNKLCQHCGKYILRTKFRRHLLRFHAVHVTCNCDICSSQIAPVGSTPVMCSECNIMFCTKFMLNAHNENMHALSDKVRIHNKGAQVCSHCDMFFDNLLQLHAHKCPMDHKNIEHRMCNSDTNISDIKDVSENVENPTVNTSAEFIKERILEYNGRSDLPYTCRLCQKAFRIKKYLYCHVRRKHIDDESKRFRCTICKMAFESKGELKRHYKTHVAIRSHQCKVCKRSYKTASHLKEHMLIHDNRANPQLSCRLCGCKFIQNGALLAHVIHHSKLKPFKCHFCQKGFTSSGDLKRHLDRYTDNKDLAREGYTCSICKKQFQNFHYLLKHFTKHSPKDPFHCTVCQHRCSSFRQLYIHKCQDDHFTEQEMEEAKQDLSAPGRKFRGATKRNDFVNGRKLKGQHYKETSFAASVLGTDSNIEQSSEHDFDDQNYVEVEIPDTADTSRDDPKTALSLFETHVIQSMLEMDTSSGGENKQLIEKHEQDKQTDFEFIVESLSEINDSSESPVTMDSESGTETIHSTNNVEKGLETESVSEIAYAVTQDVQNKEANQTQVFEMPNGSLIHVVVLKPK